MNDISVRTDKLKSLLDDNGIYLHGIIPFSACRPAVPRLYAECQTMNAESVVMIALPYKTELTVTDSFEISSYARVYDYHRRFAEIFVSLTETMKREFPEYSFRGFSDNSPIDEKHAASVAGIGVVGKNTLLITREYGSFVFLGELISDIPLQYSLSEPHFCNGCGKCAEACPAKALSDGTIDCAKCLSAISQKKQKTHEDDSLLLKNKIVWGCDKCQLACPMNRGKRCTEDSYFIDSHLGNVSLSTIRDMTDEEFSRYPFAWRGRGVITHNLELYASADDD